MQISNYRSFRRFFQLIALTVMVIGVAAGALAQQRPEPEIATGSSEKQAVSAQKYMAVTAHPLATRAAEAVLAKGGSAADAAVTAQLVLGLVEPQSSGLGGGAFALYYEAKSERLTSFDARETAPEMAWPEMFLDENGAPMDFYDAVIGGRSVGVPGTPALLHRLYKTYGELPAAELFAPAINLAENGFIVTPRLSAQIMADAGRLGRFEAAREYFYPDGHALQAGQVLKNPEYAQTLRHFRDGGLGYFYKTLAPDIVETVAPAGGFLSESDINAYQVKERAPVCGFYRAYKICSMDEPSSGGLTLLAILGTVERFDLSGGMNAQNIHLIAEASRLAFADRNQYMADPDFVKSPGAALIDPAYLAARSALIDPERRQEEVLAGKSDKERGTSHMVMVDQQGNILSMTTTIEGAFGSKLMVGGFLLNNELTDFNFEPGTANSVAPFKRPRSSMAPTIIFGPDGDPFFAVGSAGGSRIIGFVAQSIISVIDWGVGPQEALAMPHFLARGDRVELEAGLEVLKEPLEAMGHEVSVGEMNSGLTAILFQSGKMLGAADPRREGLAAGR